VVAEYLTEKNCEEILKGHDILIDALDNAQARLLLEKAAGKLGIPLIHGAIAGWYGQVSVILPGSSVLDKIYHDKHSKGIERELGNLPFTAAVIASIQAAEAIKVLLGKETALNSKVLLIDLLNCEYEIISL